MATIKDVVELINSDDEIIIDNQEKSNEILESIDNNIKEFLGIQKNRRLDDLEDRRERKSRISGVGKAAGVAALGAGALAGGLLGDALGEGGGGKGLLALAGAGVALTALTNAVKGLNTGARAAARVIKSASRALISMVDGTEARIKKLEADADARAKKLQQKRVVTDAEIVDADRRVGKAQVDLDDPRTPAAELENKQKRLEEAKAKRAALEKQKVDIERNQARIRARQAELEAVRAEKVRSRRKQRIAEMEAADAARQAEIDARAQGANRAAAERERARISQGDDPDPRGRNQNKPTVGRDAKGRFTKLPADDPDPRGRNQIPPETRAKPKPPVPTPKRISGASAAAKVVPGLNTALLAADVALSGAIGGGNQVEVDLAEAEKTKRADVAASTAGEFLGVFGDIVSLVDNATGAIVNKAFGTNLRTDRDLGGEIRKVVTPALSSAAESLNIGQGKISGGTAEVLLDSKDYLTGEGETSVKNALLREEGTQVQLKKNLNSGVLTQEQYESQLARSKQRIEEALAKGDRVAYKQERLREMYQTPPRAAQMEEVGEISNRLDSKGATLQAPAVVAPTVNSQTDSSVNVNQTNVNATSGITVDPKSKGVPGFGYGSGPR